MNENEKVILDKMEDKTNPEFSLKIKYMGEDMDLDEPTARTLAQKGMNYDRIYDELLQLRNKEQATIPEKEPQDQAEFNNRLSEFREFFRRHEDIKGMADLSKEVIGNIAEGVPIEEAFLQAENRMLKDRLTEMENRLKSPGALFNDSSLEQDDGFVRMLLAKL